MTIKDAVRSVFGNEITITDKRGVGGGDINSSSLLTLSDGGRVFVKENRNVPEDFFTAEEEGLRALSEMKAIPVVSPLLSGTDGSTSFLILEYIESGRPGRRFWEDFGHSLAALHNGNPEAFTPGGSFGFKADNFIGATRQKNDISDTFIGFYRRSRLEPQFRMAWDRFDEGHRKKASALLDRLEEFLTEPRHPSLLHGDLWGGNFMTDRNGNAMLIDPAVYVGNPEADIAMTELFGGFSSAFYHAYREACDMMPGYADRRDLYNLYQLLNHLNLFGSSYQSSVYRILERYV